MKILSLLRTVGLLSGLFLAFIFSAAAQAPAWQTARAVAAAGAGSLVKATAIDAAGNVYLAGSFSGNLVLGNTTLTSPSNAVNVFVAKFSLVTNQFIWALRAGGIGFGDDDATALAVNGTSVYVAGRFTSATADFGSTTLTNQGQNNPIQGTSDIFVAKIADVGSSGNFVWAQRAGGENADGARALAVSGTSVYVAGDFASSTADFGITSLTNFTGSPDVFVAKLNDAGSTGSFVWVKQAGGNFADYANTLVVNGASIYIAGYFLSGRIVFGPNTLINGGIYSNGFIAKLTDAGTSANFIWGQQNSGTGFDRINALAVRGANVYAAGSFNSPVATFGSTILTNGGGSNVFIAKLTDAGNTATFSWAQRAGGAGSDGANALAVIGNSVYTAGSFSSPLASFGSTSITTSGRSNLFLSKLTDAGNSGAFAWAQRAGGTSTDYDVATALAVGGTSVYVAGFSTSPTVTFGPVTLTNPNFGVYFGFLASLTDLTLAAAPAAPPREPAALFPNPAQASTTLRRPAGAGAAALALTDALGRTVRRYPAPAGPTDTALDLNGLPAGLYLLRGAGPALRLTVE